MGISLGGLTLTIDTTPGSVTGSAAFEFGGLEITTTSGRPALALFDEDGDWVCNLPAAAGIRWQAELSAPGALSARLPLDDEKTALATPKRILKVFWRGKARQAARIDASTRQTAVDGRQWVEFNDLPGAMNMLGDGIVYPEYGLDRAYSNTRTFGYMAAQGAWYASGNWTAANGVAYRDDSGFRAGKHAVLFNANPYWISKRGAYHDEPARSVQWIRHHFSTFEDEIPYRILCTADDRLRLWLDGEQIVTPDMQQGRRWRGLVEVTGTLQAGLHVLAAKVRNGRVHDDPMALILSMQKTARNGDPVDDAFLARSSPFWFAADTLPGFKRADVIRRLYFEAQDRGVKAFQVIGHDFDFDTDSNGMAWADPVAEHAFDVGTPVLAVIQQLCEPGGHLDTEVDPQTLRLRAYVRKGSNRSGSVQLNLKQSIKAHTIARTEARYNVILSQDGDADWQEDKDTASIAAYGRSETALALGSTSDPGTASGISGGQLDENSDTAYTFTTELSDLAGPQPYIDFDLGDSIKVSDGDGGHAKVRVMALTVDASEDRIAMIPELALDRS